ncbi:MAG: hypothetical protein IPM95_02225 [Sphingobacteriales bacterium]|nr:hypothetical protein [Sphingobacteriales bacterium]
MKKLLTLKLIVLLFCISSLSLTTTSCGKKGKEQLCTNGIDDDSDGFTDCDDADCEGSASCL